MVADTHLLMLAADMAEDQGLIGVPEAILSCLEEPRELAPWEIEEPLLCDWERRHRRLVRIFADVIAREAERIARDGDADLITADEVDAAVLGLMTGGPEDPSTSYFSDLWNEVVGG